LAAELCPDPPRSLSALPDPLATIWGPTHKGRKGMGRGGEREKGKGKGEKG